MVWCSKVAYTMTARNEGREGEREREREREYSRREREKGGEGTKRGGDRGCVR
jgi:hypothetical protein